MAQASSPPVSSPIQLLPNELLLAIFIHGSNADPFCGRANITLRISWVCSRWRQLAIGCFELWSNYDLNLIGEQAAYHRPTSPAMVDLFLDRSGEHNLTLSLTMSLPEHPTLVKLVEHASRWQTLVLTTREQIAAMNDGYPALSALDLPALRSLKIFSNLANPLPLLHRALNVHTFAVRIQTNKPFITLKNATSVLDLTYEIVGFLGPGDLRRLLAPYTRLKRLCLDETIPYRERLVAESYVLPVLDSLSINMRIRGGGHLAISMLTAPGLKELVLKYEDSNLRDESHTFQEINSFISLSDCSRSLKILSLTGSSMSDEETIRLLEFLPLLERLHICDPISAQKSAITSRFLKSLHGSKQSELRPSATAPLLSNLQSLKLISHSIRHMGVQKQPFDCEAFVEMIQSRWQERLRNENSSSDNSVRQSGNVLQSTYTLGGTVCNLRSVELDLHEGSVPKRVYNSLLQLEEAGMRITIKELRMSEATRESVWKFVDFSKEE